MLRARFHCKCVLWDIDFPEKINKGVKQSMTRTFLQSFSG